MDNNRVYYAIVGSNGKGLYKMAKIKAATGDSFCKVVSRTEVFLEIAKREGIPVNFRVEDSSIIESAGSFKRLDENKGAVVVVEEVQNRAGRTVRYLCINEEGKVGYIPLNQILRRCIEARKIAESTGKPQYVFTQNMKFVVPKDGGKPFLSAYPGHQIPVYVVEVDHKEKLKPKKSMVKRKENKEALSNINSMFTPEQKKELMAAKKAGVDITIIGNPEFTPKQMHVIWTNKARGCKAELFADPGYDVECMEFLASIMLNDAVNMKEVQPLLSRKYSVGNMLEIYMGIVNGVDFTKYMGYENSVEMMRFKRQCMENEVEYM